MTEKELAILNCNDYLRKNISAFVEAFVQFYGEEKRSDLTEKFKDAVFVGYQDISETEQYLNKIEKAYTKLYLKEELERVGLEGQLSFFFSDYSFSFYSIMPIANFENFYTLYTLGEEKRRDLFIKRGLANFQMVKPEATLEEYTKYFKEGSIPIDSFLGKPKYLYDNALYYIDNKNTEDEFNSSKEDFLKYFSDHLTQEEKNDFVHSEKFNIFKTAYECYQKASFKYENFKKTLYPYKKYVEKTKELEQSLSKKYYKDYILEASFLFSELERKEIEAYFNAITYKTPPACLKALSSSIYTVPITQSFSIEAQNKLENPNTPDYEKQSIMRDRVQYFKARGLDLGPDYIVYMQSKEAQMLIPTYEQARDITAIQEKYVNDFHNEYYTSTSRHKEIREEITNKGLLDPNDSFDASLYTLHGTFVSPNVKIENNELKLSSLVAIHVTDNDAYLDHKIVHELNHLYELAIHSCNGSNIEYLCGWDVLEANLDDTYQEVDTLHKRTEKRKYELLNEVINELISQDISKIMHENNMFVFNQRECAKYKGGTSYERLSSLTRDFYNEFFEDIIKSRKDGNRDHILNRVGENNMEALNQLLTQFNQQFGEFKYYQLLTDLSQNQETEATRTYYAFQTQKDIILNHMREYSKNSISK